MRMHWSWMHQNVHGWECVACEPSVWMIYVCAQYTEKNIHTCTYAPDFRASSAILHHIVARLVVPYSLCFTGNDRCSQRFQLEYRQRIEEYEYDGIVHENNPHSPTTMNSSRINIALLFRTLDFNFEILPTNPHLWINTYSCKVTIHIFMTSHWKKHNFTTFLIRTNKHVCVSLRLHW